MIFGIGTDIVKIQRMTDGINRFGEKFVTRILSDSEYLEFKNCNTVATASFLAKRFAAKEAMAKAMGTGFRNGLSMKHISVVNNDVGKPLLKLSGKAEAFVSEKCIASWHVSLADEKDYAIAYVILEM